MRVSGLYIYPLKSGRGISLQSSSFDAFGLAGDRRLMLVSPDGKFMTQRETPALTRLAVRQQGDGWQIAMEGHEPVAATPSADAARKDVTVWGTPVSAASFDGDVNRTLSAWVGETVELVLFDDHSERIASRDWVSGDTPVSFTDGFQILVTTTASLAALNSDMRAHEEGEVGMDRFRPNIVIESDEPWAEDRWAAIEIAGQRFELVKPCARCIATTQDQLTGSRDVPSPIPAMGRIRMSADRRAPGPLFGWNTVPLGAGSLSVGDTVSVIEERPEGWPLKRR